MALTLIVGNKNYSSWSMRPWLALKRTGAAFEEIVIPLDRPETRAEIFKHSPSGFVPTLKDDELTVWDSLAICEYLAEKFPGAALWPQDPSARAVARSVSAEMHSSFSALRTNMPMNMRANLPGKGRAPGVQEDVNRISAIWRDCRARFGSGGPYLFGSFSIADAMYGPVVSRFVTYQVELDADAKAYVNTMWADPALAAWAESARREPWVIEKSEL
ncbi:MAG: glutathione S-transferase family protein [Alphaproteobacteria bacterium]|nr:glutathione S-transferase family protein [Alphaproteobacteria bacterium]